MSELKTNYKCIIVDDDELDRLTKDGHNRTKPQLHEIIYLEALKGKAIQTFIRIHRSYAIQKHFIKEISSREVKMNDVSLPIGRSYKESVEKIMI